MILLIRTGDNVVVSVSCCLHNTIFFGFDHDANIEVILDITARKQDRVISKNPDRLICIYIIRYQKVTFTTNRVSFYNSILYLLKNNVFSQTLYTLRDKFLFINDKLVLPLLQSCFWLMINYKWKFWLYKCKFCFYKCKLWL